MGLNIEKIREDFPALHQLRNNKPIIYADSACMSLKPYQVINALTEYYKKFPACGGRSPHDFSVKTTKLCDEARDNLARFINAKDSSEVIWTRNATESLNLGSRILKYDGTETIITTSESHNSNLVKWIAMKNEGKINLEIVNTPLNSLFKISDLIKVIDKCVTGKFLVSLTHVSNVTAGHIPIQEIAKIVHERDGVLQLDAAQSFPHLPIDVQKLDVDLIGASMHKACGPTGMGFLYGKYELLQEINPLILGGETVSNINLPGDIEFLSPPALFEAGLQNYAGIIASGAAINYLSSIGMDNINEHEKKLSKTMIEGLNDTFEDTINIIGPKDPNERVALAAIDLKGIINPHEVAILMNDLKNIFLRSGFHCTHSFHNSLNLKEGTLRPSWYLYNTEDEVRVFIEALKEIYNLMN